MNITKVGSTDINTGTTGIMVMFKEEENAPPQPITLSTTMRPRSGLPPMREGVTYDPLEQDFVVYMISGGVTQDNRPTFSNTVYGIFQPTGEEVVLEGHLPHAPSVTLTNKAVITSFGEITFGEWNGTFELADPIWREKDATSTSDNPITVGGNAPARPTVTLGENTGDPCFRQMLTVTDRTGHGVASLLMAITPAVDDLPAENYIIHFENQPQPFAKVGSRLFFRVGVQAESLPTFIDIHMGAAIDGSAWADTLETFGVALDADIGNWRYQVDTSVASDNGVSAALAWMPVVTGDHQQRRRYTFGMDGGELKLRDDNVGVGEGQESFPNDVDSLTMMLPVEATLMTGLELEVDTGFQEAANTGASNAWGQRVMRCYMYVGPNVGDHYATWTLGPTTFPYTYSTQSSGSSNSTRTYENGMSESRSSSRSTTSWHNYVLASRNNFIAMFRKYFPNFPVWVSGNYIYINFGQGDFNIPTIGMSVQPRASTVSSSSSSSGSFPEPAWDPFALHLQSYISSSGSSSSSSGPANSPDTRGIIWESIWVDPDTLLPFDQSPETAHLLPYAVHGQARVTIAYLRRDSPHWHTAWSEVLTSNDGGNSHHYTIPSLDISGAMQVAIRLEPLSAQHAYANWGSLRVTSTPTIHLNTNRVPDIDLSEAVPARVINGGLYNLATGEGLLFDQVLVDEPGISLNMENGSMRPVSGVGQYYGGIYPSAGSNLITLNPAEPNAWAVNGNIGTADVLWEYHRKIAL